MVEQTSKKTEVITETSNLLDLTIQETQKQKLLVLSETDKLIQDGYTILDEGQYILYVNKGYFKREKEKPVVIEDKDKKQKKFDDVRIIGSCEFLAKDNSAPQNTCGVTIFDRSVRILVKPPTKIAVKNNKKN